MQKTLSGTLQKRGRCLTIVYFVDKTVLIFAVKATNMRLTG